MLTVRRERRLFAGRGGCDADHRGAWSREGFEISPANPSGTSMQGLGGGDGDSVRYKHGAAWLRAAVAASGERPECRRSLTGMVIEFPLEIRRLRRHTVRRGDLANGVSTLAVPTVPSYRIELPAEASVPSAGTAVTHRTREEVPCTPPRS